MDSKRLTLTRRTFTLGIAASAGSILAGCSRSRESLTASDTHPPDYPTAQALQELSRLVEARSKGNLRIKPYLGGQLGEEKDTLEITIFGGIDINRVNLAPLQSIAAETVVPNLPFLFRNTQHMRAALDGEPGRRILQSLYPHGLVGLCFYDSGARSFYTKEKPVMTPDDLAGLKIRVQSADIYIAMIEALGGNATPMSFGEVYQSLVQGVVDGAENNWASYESTGHYEAARYYSLTEHMMTPEILVMSRKSWEKLSPDAQQIIMTSAQDSVPYMRRLWDQRQKAAETRLRASGVIVVKPENSLFQEKVRPVWQKFLKDDALQALVQEIQNL